MDPIDIAQIVKIPNPADRIDKLLPYLLFRESFNPKENEDTVPNSETTPTSSDEYNLRGNDAKNQLILCGKGVGEKLVPIFLDPKYEFMRLEIMSMWAAFNYKEATPLIISLLEKEDQYWAKQPVANNEWWHPTPPDHARARSWSRLRISCAIKTLGSLRDARAKEILLLTKKRWQDLEELVPADGLAVLCDNALKQIENQPENSHAIVH